MFQAFADDLRAVDLTERRAKRTQTSGRRSPARFQTFLAFPGKTSKRSNPLARSLAHASPVTAPSCSPAVSREKSLSCAVQRASLSPARGGQERVLLRLCRSWTVSCFELRAFPRAFHRARVSSSRWMVHQ